jgi:hypothetical protein
LARREDGARVARRLLALADAVDGMPRVAAANADGTDTQTLRDWVIQRPTPSAYLADWPIDPRALDGLTNEKAASISGSGL